MLITQKRRWTCSLKWFVKKLLCCIHRQFKANISYTKSHKHCGLLVHIHLSEHWLSVLFSSGQTETRFGRAALSPRIPHTKRERTFGFYESTEPQKWVKQQSPLYVFYVILYNYPLMGWKQTHLFQTPVQAFLTPLIRGAGVNTQTVIKETAFCISLQPPSLQASALVTTRRSGCLLRSLWVYWVKRQTGFWIWTGPQRFWRFRRDASTILQTFWRGCSSFARSPKTTSSGCKCV